MQRCQGILTASGQFDPMLLDATGVKDDKVGNRLVIAPIDWPGDLRTAAVDGSDRGKRAELAWQFIHVLPLSYVFPGHARVSPHDFAGRLFVDANILMALADTSSGVKALIAPHSALHHFP